MTGYAFADLITFTRSTTATYVNSSGNIASAAIDAPRFAYDPVTLAIKGFQVEEQRTNLITYSEQFNNAAWAKASCTISADAAVSPSGATNADKVVSANATAQTGIGQTFTATAAAYTSSFYVKADEVQFVQLLWSSTASTEYANFDLSAGTVTQSTGTARIMAAGNGWYRISLTSTLAAVTTSAFCWMVSSGTVGRAPTYAGNGTNGFLVWGAQLEIGSFATSYIPTVASQVTRSADVPTMTGTDFSSWFNGTAGTIYVEAEYYAGVFSNLGGFSVNSGNVGANNLIGIGSGSPSTSARSFIYNGATVEFANFVTGGGATGAVVKQAVAYATNDAVVCANGVLSAVDTTVTLPTGLNQARIGAGGASSGVLSGYYRVIRFYPERLTNAQLQALTA